LRKFVPTFVIGHSKFDIRYSIQDFGFPPFPAPGFSRNPARGAVSLGLSDIFMRWMFRTAFRTRGG